MFWNPASKTMYRNGGWSYITTRLTCRKKQTDSAISESISVWPTVLIRAEICLNHEIIKSDSDSAKSANFNSHFPLSQGWFKAARAEGLRSWGTHPTDGSWLKWLKIQWKLGHPGHPHPSSRTCFWLPNRVPTPLRFGPASGWNAKSCWHKSRACGKLGHGSHSKSIFASLAEDLWSSKPWDIMGYHGISWDMGPWSPMRIYKKWVYKNVIPYEGIDDDSQRLVVDPSFDHGT